VKRLEGKIVLITGAARGMGRSHAVRCAQEGADVVLVDACAQIDGVVANAGVCGAATWDDVTTTQWNLMIDINLTGVWHALRAGIPHLMERGGGSLVAISSSAGIKGTPLALAYTAA
jgi:NAD(P)-dependent dehydrogenase (short-subunit alcohol dehydrogenase family)